MKKATLNLLKNKDNPTRYIESFALPFKYIENDTHYINPMTNPLCFLDFIHGSCGYKINLSHIVALRQLVHNQNVLLQVPEYTHSSQFVCVYSLFLLLTKNGYVIIHSSNGINYIRRITEIYNTLPKEMQIKDIDNILKRIIVKNNKIDAIDDDKILLHVFDRFNFNIETHIDKDCQLLIINDTKGLKPYKRYIANNFKYIKRKFSCAYFSLEDLGINEDAYELYKLTSFRYNYM